MIDKNSDRTKWLEQTYALLLKEFKLNAPAKVQIGFSFCTKGNRKNASGNGQTRGECLRDFVRDTDEKEKETLIALNPGLFKNPVQLLGVMLHEQIHACGISGHGKEFSQVAKDIGFGKPWKQATILPDLAEHIGKILEQLGNFPEGWGDLEPTKPKQTTRMLLYTCPVCEMKVRTAQAEAVLICLGTKEKPHFEDEYETEKEWDNPLSNSNCGIEEFDESDYEYEQELEYIRNWEIQEEL
jgi:hypothetical protein